MIKKKLIIWDFDGVIVDSRELALEYTQKQYEDVTAEMHRNLFCGNIFTELEKLKRKNITEDEIENFLEKSYWPRKLQLVPVEGIEAVIKELDGEYEMVINSSSQAKRIFDYLEKWNLAHYFKKIYGKEIHKSKVEKFKFILKEFRVEPNECVLVTDTIGDVYEALELGIKSVGVLWGYQCKDHFEPFKKEIVLVDTPDDLAKAIRGILI